MEIKMHALTVFGKKLLTTWHPIISIVNVNYSEGSLCEIVPTCP